jgi:4-hydroxymandelate oxidase
MEASTDLGLTISDGWRRGFGGPSAAALDPMLRVYLSDLVRPYDLALREDLLAAGGGQSYGEMAAALLRDVLPAGQPIDLLVFAFAVPDVVPGRATACYLSDVCPGKPMALALCDAGAAAAFTGLRLVSQYVRAGQCARALLVVAEQSVLHYDSPAPAPLPAVNTVVALLCERGEAAGESTGTGGTARGGRPAGGGARPVGGGARLAALRQHAGVSRNGLAELLPRELAVLGAGEPGAALVLGGIPGDARQAAAAPPAAAQVITAPAGQPYTGLWWEVAGGLAAWRAQQRRVLLACYDEPLGYLSLAALDARAAGPATR